MKDNEANLGRLEEHIFGNMRVDCGKQWQNCGYNIGTKCVFQDALLEQNQRGRGLFCGDRKPKH